MRLETIPNRYPACMGIEVEQGLKWAEQVDIASAYVSNATLGRLELALEQAQVHKSPFRIRLLCGLYQRFTSPQALARMLRLQRAYPSKFLVRIARNNRFHWKLYIFRDGNSRRLYVGSANLTDDGLDASGELSVRISAKSNDSIVKSLETEFDNLWQNDAFLLSNKILKDYEKVGRPPKFVTAPQKDDPISALLKKAERPQVLLPSKPEPRIVFLDADISVETEEIMRSEKTWHRQGWDLICLNHKYLYDSTRNARIILHVSFVNARECWLEFRRVEDAVEIETPDGKYFVAHSAVPYAWRGRYDAVKRELAEVGLTSKRIKSNRKLTEKQIEVLCRLLHIKREKLDINRR